MAKLNGVKTIDMVNGEITKVEYGGEVYVKVIEEVALNDIVLSRGVTDARSGNFYVVNERDRYDDISILDDEGEKRSLLQQFDVFRKQSVPSLDERVSVLESKVAELGGETIKERITHNGAEYKLVDRKAQAGDVVVFTENTSCHFKSHTPYGPVNERLSVDSDGFGLSRVYFSDYNRTPNNVKVYEPVAQGTQAEEPLKVGDYAKVVKADKFSIGDIVYISKEDSVHFHCEKVTSGHWHFADKEGELVHATDEEVTEAKRQAEAQVEQAKIEAKWASIGRKPNEFKRGDIVRYMGKASSNGSIVEVPEDSVQGWTKIIWGNLGRSTEKNSELELITPVESRFDHA